MTMDEPTVESTLLLTSIGSTASQNLLWALQRDSAPVFSVGANAEVPSNARGLVNIEVQVPFGNNPDFIDRIIELVRIHDVELFIPVMEPELLAVSVARDRLDATGAQTIVSPEHAIRLCRSKSALMRRFDDIGIPHPRLVAPDSVNTPVFARPEQGTGSMRARMLNAPDARRALQTEPDLVFTECIDAPEFSVDAYADRPGHLVHAIARSRDLVRHGLVVRSKVAPLSRQVRDYVERVCAGIELDGFFNIQYFDTANRGPLFFDLNPRLGGGMALSFAAGLDASEYLRARIEHRAPATARKEIVGLQLLRRFHNVIIETNEL